MRSGLALTLLLLCAACQSRQPDPPPGDRAAINDAYRKLVDGYNQQTGARQISVARLQQRLQAGQPLILLDIREKREQQVSTLRGARPVHPDDVETLALDLPKEALIVAYCTAGYRSGHAAVALEKRLGRKVWNLDGGIIRWFNSGGEVVDANGQSVDRIDPYGDEWKPYVHPR